MHVLLQILARLYLSAQISTAITPYASHLSKEQIGQISYYIAEASEETKIDPYLIAAIMWHESGFRPNLSSSTDDHGLMQVHWQPTSEWLKGLTKQDLLDPRTNILVGAHELSWFRKYCKYHDEADAHLWWGHYKWGLVVHASKYGDTVSKRREVLSRAARIQKPGT